MKFPLPLLALALLTGARLFAADDHPLLPLWPNGAPGSEARKDEPEKRTGGNVNNIHNPSITVYLPAKDKATGVAIVVAPGGGHANLAIDHEGYNVAKWLADHGIAAFILRYRLAKDAAVPKGGPQPYTVDRDELGDAQRAIRMVRLHAAEWGVRPDAVGIIGFSAGGELSLLAATRGEAGKADAPDALDRLSSRPDFAGLIYPGNLGRTKSGTDIVIGKDTPPLFLACGYDDRPDISQGLPEFYLLCKKAGVIAELHVYDGIGHGFGIRPERHNPAEGWPDRLRDWLTNRKFIAAAAQ